MREYNELPTAKSKNIGQIALEVVKSICGYLCRQGLKGDILPPGTKWGYGDIVPPGAKRGYVWKWCRQGPNGDMGMFVPPGAKLSRDM